MLKTRVIFTIEHETEDALDAFVESADYMAIGMFENVEYEIEDAG